MPVYPVELPYVLIYLSDNLPIQSCIDGFLMFIKLALYFLTSSLCCFPQLLLYINIRPVITFYMYSAEANALSFTLRLLMITMNRLISGLWINSVDC